MRWKLGFAALSATVAAAARAVGSERAAEGPQGRLYRRSVGADAGQLRPDRRGLRILCEGAECTRRHRRRSSAGHGARRPARRDARRFQRARARHLGGGQQHLGNEPDAHASRRLSDGGAQPHSGDRHVQRHQGDPAAQSAALCLFGRPCIRGRGRGFGQARGKDARTARARRSATASRRRAASPPASMSRAPRRPEVCRPERFCFRRP